MYNARKKIWQSSLLAIVALTLFVGCSTLSFSRNAPIGLPTSEPTTAAQIIVPTLTATSVPTVLVVTSTKPPATPTSIPTAVPVSTATASPTVAPTVKPTKAQPFILATRTPTMVPLIVANDVVDSGKTHVLGSGETLSDVAVKYGVRIKDIMVLNDIASARSVVSGSRLQIPLPLDSDGMPIPTPTPLPPNLVTHVLRSGETLSEVARAYGTSVEALMEINGIEQATYVISGTRLKIPQR